MKFEQIEKSETKTRTQLISFLINHLTPLELKFYKMGNTDNIRAYSVITSFIVSIANLTVINYSKHQRSVIEQSVLLMSDIIKNMKFSGTVHSRVKVKMSSKER